GIDNFPARCLGLNGDGRTGYRCCNHELFHANILEVVGRVTRLPCRGARLIRVGPVSRPVAFRPCLTTGLAPDLRSCCLFFVAWLASVRCTSCHLLLVASSGCLLSRAIGTFLQL